MTARIRHVKFLAALLVTLAASLLTTGVSVARFGNQQTAPAVAARAQNSSDPSFADLVRDLSEPNGYFDTDNLISNEKSYLQVIPQLEQRGVTGGVYIGVGPDQNFSYIARTRPKMVFLIDIRRDNLLLHLLFRALFAASRNRVEFLSLLTGRRPPDLSLSQMDTWREASVEKIAAYIDAAKPLAAAELQDSQVRLHELIRGFGVPLSPKDLSTIDRFHSDFIADGLTLRFHSFGRPPQSYDPSYRELLLETDGKGRQVSYIASEADFQFVRSIEASGAVIPVVGDLAGPHALSSIGQWMAKHQERLSVFYVSNVEDYLFRDGTFARYVANLQSLPHDNRSVLIRSVFGRFVGSAAAPGYYSASVVVDLNAMLANYSAGKYRTYSELLGR